MNTGAPLVERSFETISLELREKHVLVVHLDRPEVLNAKNTLMGQEQLDVFQSLYVDRGAIRCVVITGRGDRAFSVGGDLKERKGMTDEGWRRQHALFESGYIALKCCPIPVIAAVNGLAFGGGCETALASDFIYAAPEAQFALTEVSLGIMPGCMGTQHLPGAVGERRAKELILTAKRFSATEAFDWGLVNKIVPRPVLLDAAVATGAEIAANAPLSIIKAKKAISIARHVDWMTGYQIELEAYDRLVVSDDRQEGIDAFNQKRKPSYKGH